MKEVPLMDMRMIEESFMTKMNEYNLRKSIETNLDQRNPNRECQWPMSQNQLPQAMDMCISILSMS